MGNKITWDDSGKHLFETGVDHVVLYRIDANGAYSNGYAWNGVSNITENPSGAEATPIWADNIKYLNLYSTEQFGATIEAFTYPDEFAECDGSAEVATGVHIGQQSRKAFGLSYRTRIGNEIVGDSLGYKLHLVYGAKASPSQRAYSTVNDNPEADSMSWELNTTPVNVSGMSPTSTITIDSTKVNATKLAALETILYGQAVSDAVYEQVAADAVFDNTKTYYTKAGSIYSVATGITEFAANTTYYTLKAAAVATAVDPRLPLPDEVAEILA